MESILRSRFPLLVALGILVVPAVQVVSANDLPGYFYLHDSAWNVTASGTSVLVGDAASKACLVDMNTKLGLGNEGYDFTVRVKLDALCRPTLSVADIVAVPVTADSLTSDYFVQVENYQNDVVDIPMTLDFTQMEWNSNELSSPVYGTRMNGGYDYLEDGWDVLYHNHGWSDPGCNECIYVSAFSVTRFWYPFGPFQPFCYSACDHYQQTIAEAYFGYPVLSCDTWGYVPVGSTQECVRTS